MKKKLILITVAALILLLITATALAGARFVGNKKSKLYHDTTHKACQAYIKKMANKNKVFFKSASSAKKAGYKPCKKCY